MTDRRPNILVVLFDQLRYDLAMDEQSPVETPTLDRLRSEGTTFTSAYTPISICTSSRTSFLTGLYPHNHGLVVNVHEPYAYRRNLPSETPTFAEILAGNGYRASHVGKWHVGRDQEPADFGFDHLGQEGEFVGTEDDEGFLDYQRDRGVDPDAIAVEDELRAEMENGSEQVAGTVSIPPAATPAAYFTEQTIDRLEAIDADDEPFLHYLAHVDPHHPYVVPEPYASMYDPAEIDPWPSFAETFDGKPQAQENYVAYRGVEEFDWETWTAAISNLYGSITFLDDLLGDVLDALDERGLAEETAVVVASDHGDFAGSHRQFNKGPMMYEETYRIPIVARWPGHTDPGSTCDEFVQLHDLMPTIVDVAGLEVPDGLDGRSLRPLLEGTVPDDWRESVYCEYHGDEFGRYSQRMVRTRDHKYVFNSPDVDELYDLRRDPHELTNLIDHPDYAAVRDRLESKTREWMDRTDDPLGVWGGSVLTGDGDVEVE